MTGVSAHAGGGAGTASTGLFVVRSTIPHVYRSNLDLIVRFWSMPHSTFVAFWNVFDRVFCSTTTMVTGGRKGVEKGCRKESRKRVIGKTKKGSVVIHYSMVISNKRNSSMITCCRNILHKKILRSQRKRQWHLCTGQFFPVPCHHYCACLNIVCIAK